ncbi:MAG: hypothetical protein IJ716_13485 [Lachnospiraceae bacterium]|nr:hypothetical protein [Lachnospiraceae bacterium]
MDNYQMQNTPQNNAQPNGYQPNGYQPAASQQPVIPEEYRPISMWGYFGYQLLFAIPCIGFIIMIVFALGGTKNINLKNFARSFFCWMVICLILTIIIAVLGGASGLFAAMAQYSGY